MRTRWTFVVVVMMLLAPVIASAQTEWVDDPANPVLVPGSPGTWDAWSYVNEVVLVDGTYHMFYMGQEEGSPFGTLYDIGHATSSDGSSWTLDPANPVVVRGAAEEWDSDSVAFPAVLHDGTEFRMWYIGHDGEVDAVGYATSPDGTTWTKHADKHVDGRSERHLPDLRAECVFSFRSRRPDPEPSLRVQRQNLRRPHDRQRRAFVDQGRAIAPR